MPERKSINFITSTDYDSSTSPNYSTVTLTNDTYDLHYDGVNIQKDRYSVGIGDVLTTNGKWYDGGTIDSSIASTVVGVVINRKGNTVLLHSVDGFNGSTKENDITVMYVFRNVAYSPINNISQFPNIDVNFKSASYIYRKSGYTSYRPGVNYYRLYQYFSEIGKSSESWISISGAETSNFAGTTANTKLNSNQCFENSEYLVSKYGTYENYLKMQIIDYSNLNGLFSFCIGKAHEWTKKLAQYKVADTPIIDSKCQALETGATSLNDASFPIAFWANNYSKVCTNYNLGVGQWYLIGADELFEWFSDQDKVNKTIKTFTKLGQNVSKLLTSNRWCCARYSHSNAWCYSDGGNFDNRNFAIPLATSIVCSFDL